MIRRRISPQSTLIKMFDGEVLFREGDPARCFYLVEKGRVQILNRAGDLITACYEADQLLGISEVLAQARWTHTATVAGATIIRVFPANLLFSKIDDMPAAHQQFIGEVARLAH